MVFFPLWLKLMSLLPPVVAVVSLTASATLVVWLSALSSLDQAKLLPRQLKHLSIATILDTALVIPWHTLDSMHKFLGVGAETSSVLDAVCNFGICGNLPFVTSVLIEVHITLATVAMIFRQFTFVRCLSWCLPLVWPLGFMIGVLVPIFDDARWSVEMGRCTVSWTGGEEIKAYLLLVSFLLCVTVYFAGFLRACCSAGATVQRRVFGQAGMFIGAAAFAWGPFVIWTHLQDPLSQMLPSRQAYFYVVFTVLLSNGLLNACIYALKSRFVRRTRRRALTRESLGEGGGLRSTQACEGLARDLIPEASFSVAFDPVEEVYQVPKQTKRALKNAEREISEIEAEREKAEGEEDGGDDEQSPHGFLGVFDDEASLQTLGSNIIRDFYAAVTSANPR